MKAHSQQLFLLKPLKWNYQQQVVHWKLVGFRTDSGDQGSPQLPARLLEKVSIHSGSLLCPWLPGLGFRVSHLLWPPTGCSSLEYPFLFPSVSSLKSQTWAPSSPNPKPPSPMIHSTPPSSSLPLLSRHLTSAFQWTTPAQMLSLKICITLPQNVDNLESKDMGLLQLLTHCCLLSDSCTGRESLMKSENLS